MLSGLLERLGLPGSLLSLLFAHASAVERESGRLGLISPNDAQIVVSRHVADSLLFALARRPEPGENWVDVGSGAGFPGIVLACCYPESHFTLLEPLGRRAGFLELSAADLGLGNVRVDARRLEELGSGDFDVAVARALGEPKAALRGMVRLLRAGGLAIVAVSSAEASTVSGGTLVRIEDLGSVDSPGLFSMMTRRG